MSMPQLWKSRFRTSPNSGCGHTTDGSGLMRNGCDRVRHGTRQERTLPRTTYETRHHPTRGSSQKLHAPSCAGRIHLPQYRPSQRRVYSRPLEGQGMDKWIQWQCRNGRNHTPRCRTMDRQQIFSGCRRAVGQHSLPSHEGPFARDTHHHRMALPESAGRTDSGHRRVGQQRGADRASA